MPWTSKVPDAVDALFAALKIASELQGVTVRDGASTSQAKVMEIVSVGYTGEEAQTDVEATLTPEGLARATDRERFTIRCAVAVLKGSTDLPAARRRAYELLAAVGDVLARDRTLGGTVLRAMIGTHSLNQDQTDGGAQAVIVFGVDCEAFSR